VTVDLTLLRAVAITAAGCGAGFVNSIVGSGTLISFPTLVGVGYLEKIANITNNTGLVPGSFSAAAAQRKELKGQRTRLLRLVPASAIGGLIGALLLLALPGRYFKRVVPFLILVGVALVVLGPIIQRRVKERAVARGDSTVTAPEHVSPWLQLGVMLAGIYGGYFGAAQGVILLGLMGTALDDSIARINATKNVLAGTVNFVAATVFVIHGGVVWSAAALLAGGSVVGGVLGSKVGRRIPPNVLRGIIVVVGLTAAAKLFLAG
jgi:uncharacterized protein